VSGVFEDKGTVEAYSNSLRLSIALRRLGSPVFGSLSVVVSTIMVDTNMRKEFVRGKAKNRARSMYIHI
jgi:hypothetical protein